MKKNLTLTLQVILLGLIITSFVFTALGSVKNKSDLKELERVTNIALEAKYNFGTYVARNAMFEYVLENKESLFSETGELIIHIDKLLVIEDSMKVKTIRYNKLKNDTN